MPDSETEMCDNIIILKKKHAANTLSKLMKRSGLTNKIKISGRPFEVGGSIYK